MNDTGEDATYMVGQKQVAFQTGIQDRTPIDVTANEVTYVGAQKKVTTGTFGEIRDPQEIIMDTFIKDYSKNE